MKIIGCALILISSILCAYFYENGLKAKISKLEELIAFITYIKNKIEYFSVPINKIYEQYENKSDFINNLITNQSLEGVSFDKGTNNAINEFFCSLGNGYKKEQIALCEYNIGLFNEKVQALKTEYPSKTKVFRSMSLFTGISTIILLI